jgi:hypothetical protein
MEERHAKGDLKKLNPAEIKALKEAGINPEVLKGEKRTGKRDLYKTKMEPSEYLPKGKGPGESTGLNIKDIM